MWSEAADRVAADPRFRAWNHRLTPQVGLLPIGRIVARTSRSSQSTTAAKFRSATRKACTRSTNAVRS
jgi:hypothetical protein